MHPSDPRSSSSSSTARHSSAFSTNANEQFDGTDNKVNRLSTWYEDLEEYESNLEAMATATLDQTFQDEMQHVNQWFGFLSDAEKTATLYTLLQHSSQVQIRFFIHLLQELRKPKPNTLNRGSERASALANLNRRQPSIVAQQQQQNVNRHSFAMGDTQNLGKLFGTMGTDWFSSDDQTQSQHQHQHPLQQPQPRATLNNRSQHQLRPKSVMELGGSGSSVLDSAFSNTWLKQRQPSLSNNVIERPRSADISSWALPAVSASSNAANTSVASWKPLQNQHDIDIHLWKDPMSIDPINSARRSSSAITSAAAATAASSNLRKTSFAASQYLNTQSNLSSLNASKPGASRSSSFESIVANDFGYGSDQSDASTSSRRFRQTHQQPAHMSAYSSGSSASNNKPIPESNNEDHVDMDLIKDVPAWFRSMRLHKYNNIFEHMRWQDIIQLDDAALQDKGVAALGARRKMLKVFENVREHCRLNVG
ncbi:hypothetical protein [Parasitella parasitica]|uniref:SAM domain-containing protein n=1 Tax=Parasitella parasitica TaxID=35722 RepID=A0A0B7NB45_9FUNG|nr:hypothetical protein [Parasitella parasitica]